MDNLSCRVLSSFFVSEVACALTEYLEVTYEERKGRWSNCKIFWLRVGEGQFNDMVSLFLIVE